MKGKLNYFVNGVLLISPALIIYTHQLVTALLLISFIVWLFLAKKRPYYLGWDQYALFICSASIFLFALLLLALAGWPDSGFRELDNYSHFLLFYPFVAILARNRANAYLFWLGVAFVGVLGGVTAAIEVLLLGKPSANSFGSLNQIFYGNYSGLLAFLTLFGSFWFTERGDRLGTWLSLAGVVGGLTGLIFSDSRGGIVAIPIFIALCLAYLAIKKSYRLLAFSLVIACVSGGGLLFSASSMKGRLMLIDQEVRAYVVEGNDKTSVGLRLYMWETAWHAFTEKPVLGHGPGHFQGLPYVSFLREHHPQENNSHKHAHSEFLHTAATKGLVGLVPLLGILIIPLMTAIKFIRRRNLIYGFALACIPCGFAIYGMTDTVFLRSTGVDTYMLLISILTVLGYQLQHTHHPP